MVHFLISLAHLSSDSPRRDSHLLATSGLIIEVIDQVPKLDKLFERAVVLPVDLAAVFNLTLLSYIGQMYYKSIQKLARCVYDLGCRLLDLFR